MHEHLPNTHDVTNGTGEDKEMEHGMDVGLVVRESVDDCACDIADTFGNEPPHSSRFDAIHQRFESHEAGEAHEDEASRFDVAVLAQTNEADNGASDGGKPHEAEQTPAPPTGIAHGDERDGRVRAGDVPVNGGMVETAPNLARRPRSRNGVIDGRADVTAYHANEIEDDGRAGPTVVGAEAPDEEDSAHDDTQKDAKGMAPRVERIFAF